MEIISFMFDKSMNVEAESIGRNSHSRKVTDDTKLFWAAEITVFALVSHSVGSNRMYWKVTFRRYMAAKVTAPILIGCDADRPRMTISDTFKVLGNVSCTAKGQTSDKSEEEKAGAAD